MNLKTLGDLPPVLTVPEVARVLRVSRATAYELARTVLPTFKCSRSVRVSRDALIQFITAGGTRLSDESKAQTIPRGGHEDAGQ